MKNKFKSIAMAAIIYSALAAHAQQPPVPETVDVTQAQKMSVQGTLLLDVREQDEYDEIHASHATLIPLSQLRSRLAEIADFKDKPVVVICRSGKRSQKALRVLQETGFSRASSVEGGMLAWEQAGLEVIRK